MSAMQKKSVCAYCYGHGLYKAYVDTGARRVMEKGTNGKPMHPREQVYQCDVCCKPSAAAPCPTKFVRVN